MNRPYGRRSILARAVAVATLGAACFAVAGCGGGKPAAQSAKAAKAAKAAETPLTSTEKPVGIIGTHVLLKPECMPVKGRRWNYPGQQKISSTEYELFAINYPCSKATVWTARLLRAQIKFKKGGDESVLKGPKGFYCSAWPDTSNHAYAGGCQTKSGNPEAFAWNWNVLNRRVVFTPDENGVVHLEKLLGSDVEGVLRKENGHYRLDIHNTSGVGYLDRFTWSPPPGWKITKITKTIGGHCQVAAATGIIWCSGKLQPPTCLCKGDGAILTIDFTAAVPPNTMQNGHPLLFGAEGSLIKIKQMTPVPYLIPGTPEAAKQQTGV